MFSMIKILFISIVINLTALNASADKMVAVTEDIKYLSQKISNDYLYLFHNPKNVKIKEELNNSIKKLEDDFRRIAKNTESLDTKNILDFLSYSKDQMKETISEDLSKDSVASMLDFSDTMLEGAQSILDTQNQTSYKNKFHLMMISKLYLAINLGFDSKNNKNSIKKEIELFDNNNKSNDSWVAFKDILENRQNCFIPHITTILIKDLENNEK